MYSFSCSIYGICGGLVENVIWRRKGWLKTSEYRYMGEGSKIAQKICHMIFERSVS